MLRGRELELEARVEKLKASLLTGDEIAPLVEVMRTVEGERLKVVEELAIARREAASPVAAALGECKTLADIIGTAADPADARTRLRGVLRRAVEDVRCLFVARGAYRLAAVQVQFTGGGRRVFLFWHRRGHGSQSGSRPAAWGVVSAAAVAGRDKFGLADPRGVAAWERFLNKLDVTALA